MRARVVVLEDGFGVRLQMPEPRKPSSKSRRQRKSRATPTSTTTSASDSGVGRHHHHHNNNNNTGCSRGTFGGHLVLRPCRHIRSNCRSCHRTSASGHLVARAAVAAMGLQLPPVPVPGREPPAVAPAPAAPAIKTSIVREKQVVTPPKPKQVQVTDHRQPATTSPQPLANVSQGAVDAAALDQRIEWLHEQVEDARREAEAEAVKANAAWSGANRLTRCMCFCYEPDRVRMSAVAWLAGEQLRRDAAEVVMLRLRGAVASASAELEGIRTAASPAMAAASAGCESVVQRGVGALAAAADRRSSRSGRLWYAQRRASRRRPPPRRSGWRRPCAG